MRARSATPQTVVAAALAAVFAAAGLVYAMSGLSHVAPPATATTQTPAAAATGPEVPRPVTLVDEPRHRVVFDAGTTRVHDVQVPSGDTTLYHVHDTPILYVPISRSSTRTQVLGAEWAGGDPSRSQPPPSGPQRVSSIVSYVGTPVTHRVNNNGDGLFRLIAVVNRAAGSEAAPAMVAGLPETPELVNRYYRAFRVVLQPGASTPLHTHDAAVVTVQQTAGRVTVEGASDTTLEAAGAFAYHDGGLPHRVRNTGSTPVDVIDVELRGSR